MSLRSLLLLGLSLLALSAGEVDLGGGAPWYLQDPAGGGAEGVAAQVLRTRTWTPPEAPIVVAVIDSGCDLQHPVFQGLIWENPGEKAGKPGVDDDANGYVDDLVGWNFIGSADGTTQVFDARMEETRELARLRDLAKIQELTDEELAYRDTLQTSFDERWTALARNAQGMYTMLAVTNQLERELIDLGFPDLDTLDLSEVRKRDPFLAQLVQMYQGPWSARQQGRALLTNIRNEFRTHYNYDFDDRSVIGDQPADLTQRSYGNALVDHPQRNGHGTSVAGAIVRVVAGAVGQDDAARYLRILPIRTVPDGDEHDKDVANAIRYATAQGARVINMSFGKRFSPGKAAVDAAVREAMAKGVLLVHGCGNDGVDTDVHPFYPHPLLADETQRCANWLEVGASTPQAGQLAADFSNYGHTSVDVFAPGVDILSAAAGGGEETSDGTSLAAPVVSGVAVLALIAHPDLDGAALATAIRASARPYPDRQVPRPGGGRRAPPVSFADLSISGGVIDAKRLLDHLATPRVEATTDPGPTTGPDTKVEPESTTTPP